MSRAGALAKIQEARRLQAEAGRLTAEAERELLQEPASNDDISEPALETKETKEARRAQVRAALRKRGIAV